MAGAVRVDAHVRPVALLTLHPVRQLNGRDQIDRVSVHPLSMLLALTMAPFYHCNPCRLQYHEWRPVHPSVRTESKS